MLKTTNIIYTEYEALPKEITSFGEFYVFKVCIKL